MASYLLQTIPKGIEEITTVLGLLGILLFLLFAHVKPKVKWTIVFLLLFTVSWRLVFSRSQEMSSRYISGLIIPFLLLALYAFHQLTPKKTLAVRWCMAIMIAVTLLNYIKKDLKRNKRDLNYYAIAEIAQKSDADKMAEMFFVPEKDFERISILSKTDNIREDQRDYFPCKNNNFGRSYYPAIIDVDFDNSIIPDERRKQFCSLITSKNSKKKVNLFRSAPLVHLEVNPSLASIDATKSILRNGIIEAIDSAQESQNKLVAYVSNYRSSLKYDDFIRTPQNAYFYVDPKTAFSQKPLFGIESLNPIDGQNSASIRVGEGTAYLVFSQRFSKGCYSYSFVVQGKRGTMIRPVYRTYFNNKWHTTPICLFTIPNFRTFRIFGSFDFEGLKETDFFRIGVEVQNGETLIDDVVFNKKEVKTQIDDQTFSAEAQGIKNNPETDRLERQHAAMQPGMRINVDRVKNAGAPVISGVPATAILKVWNAEHDVLVYQDENRLLWLIGKKIDQRIEVICLIHTDEPERLPEKRIRYGFDNRGFRITDKRAANELESIEGYRVFTREIPKDYFVTDIDVGFRTNGTTTWRENFRIE